jgi:hypothetical protein
LLIAPDQPERHTLCLSVCLQVASTRTLHPRRLGLVSLPVTRLALAQVQPGVQALDLWYVVDTRRATLCMLNNVPSLNGGHNHCMS